MEKRILTKQSILLIRYLLEDEQISCKVCNNKKDKDMYPLCTICTDGTIILGKTKYEFFNKLLSCQDKIPFDSFALRVWDALVAMSTGENSIALKEDLSREIAEKAIREGDYNGLINKLVLCYKHVCNNKSGIDDSSEGEISEALNIKNRDRIVTVVNGNKHKTLVIKDSIGDPFIELGYDLTKMIFRNGK